MREPDLARVVLRASLAQGAEHYTDLVVKYLLPGYLRYIGLPFLDSAQFSDLVRERIQYFMDAQEAQGRTAMPVEIWRWIHGAVVSVLRERAYEIARSKNESGDLMRQWSNPESAPPEIRRMVPPQMTKTQTTTMADKGVGSDVFAAGLTGGMMDRKILASLALRERRAGRNPAVVLSAAVKGIGPDQFDTGTAGRGKPSIDEQLSRITRDASVRFGIGLKEMGMLIDRLGIRQQLMEPGYVYQDDHVRQWGDEIKRMLLEADWYKGTVQEAAY